MSAPAWRCDAHGVTTTGDCPRCDDELIALTEEAAVTSGPACSVCGGGFSVGEEAFVEDWKVLDVAGSTAAFRLETRYTHIACTPDP